MNTEWLVNILNKPMPALLPNLTTEQERLVQLWGEFFPSHPEDGSGDHEDYFEQAVRLDSALNSFGRDSIFLITDYGSGRATELRTGLSKPTSELLHLPRFGAQEKNAIFYAPGNKSLSSESLADRYMSSRVFRENAGRRMILTGNNAGDQDIYRDVHQLAQEGFTKLFIKASATKKGIWIIHVSEVMSISDIRNLLLQEISWSLIMYEGERDGFSVQAFTQMNYEYRLFAVGGKPVTGAGCIEEHTPLDNKGEQFSTAVRHTRIGTKSVIGVLPDVVAELVEFGSNAAAEMAVESPGMFAFTLDVAMDSDRKPLIVERNGLLNAGLYASQPNLVTDALSKLDF